MRLSILIFLQLWSFSDIFPEVLHRASYCPIIVLLVQNDRCIFLQEDRHWWNLLQVYSRIYRIFLSAFRAQILNKALAFLRENPLYRRENISHLFEKFRRSSLLVHIYRLPMRIHRLQWYHHFASWKQCDSDDHSMRGWLPWVDRLQMRVQMGESDDWLVREKYHHLYILLFVIQALVMAIFQEIQGAYNQPSFYRAPLWCFWLLEFLWVMNFSWAHIVCLAREQTMTLVIFVPWVFVIRHSRCVKGGVDENLKVLRLFREEQWYLVRSMLEWHMIHSEDHRVHSHGGTATLRRFFHSIFLRYFLLYLIFRSFLSSQEIVVVSQSRFLILWGEGIFICEEWFFSREVVFHFH